VGQRGELGGRREDEAHPFLDDLDNLRRLHWITHRVGRKVCYPSKKLGVELVMIHVLSNPRLEDVRDP
jgi:hypothetical protein